MIDPSIPSSPYGFPCFSCEAPLNYLFTAQQVKRIKNVTSSVMIKISHFFQRLESRNDGFDIKGLAMIGCISLILISIIAITILNYKHSRGTHSVPNEQK